MPALVEQTQFLVMVAGTDVSTRWASRLIKLETNDFAGEDSDTCTITLDDTDGVLQMPQKGAPIAVGLGPRDGGIQIVYEGIVDDVASEGARGGGMTLRIEGKSADTSGKQKRKRNKHHDDKTVGDAMTDAAKYAGVQLTVCPRIKQLKRKYIAQDGESFLHFVQRLSIECGGTFKMIGGTRGVVLDRNEGQTAGGGSICNVVAFRPGNLITWDVNPLITRPRYKEITARWYDRSEAKWKEKKVQVPTGNGGGGGGSSGGGSSGGSSSPGSMYPDDNVRHSRVDETESEQVATGQGKESDREKGIGTVKIDGDASARAEGILTLVGARPGVDGSYTMHQVTQELDRRGGWITTITLRRPNAQGDSRGGSGGIGGSGAGTQSPGQLYPQQ